MRTFVWRVLAIVVVLGSGPAAGGAQPAADEVPFCEDPTRRHQTLDTRGLGAIYCTPSPALASSLEAAHASARPIFYGAVPLAWGAAALRGGEGAAAAYRLTLSQGVTYGLVLGLKHAVGRPRPYVRRPLVSRSAHYGRSQDEQDQAFPSGHAALSAALATSWSLTHPRWYVIAPSATWAAGVALSRLYLGVHYPSDVFVGAALGAGFATLLYQFRGVLTPPRLRGDARAAGGPPPVGIRVRF
ncbi:MAG: phosphatase PAP2 family protein [Salinibacter sp.]